MLESVWKLGKALLVLGFSLLFWLTFSLTGISLARELPSESSLSGALPKLSSPVWAELDPGNISSEKVNQFVQACLQVVALIERREGELQGAETESESLLIEQEIEAEALAIIERAGLTRQEYLQLLGLANTDPEFGERIAVQLQETAT